MADPLEALKKAQHIYATKGDDLKSQLQMDESPPNPPGNPVMRARTWPEAIGDTVRKGYQWAADSGPGRVTDALGISNFSGMAEDKPRSMMSSPYAVSVGPGHVPLSDYDGYLRRVAGEGLQDALGGPSPHMQSVIDEIGRGQLPIGRTVGDIHGMARNMKNISAVIPNLGKAVPVVIDELKNSGRGSTGSGMSKQVVDALSDVLTIGHKPEWYKP